MKKLTLFTLVLAFCVIQLGAFTRLTDAGLGCPDWPGCYGFLSVPNAEQIATAEARYPERPVEAAKAWVEMVHRYVAGILGLMILALAIQASRRSGTLSQGQPNPRKLPWALVGLVAFQAALGMWTVTLNLLPVIVMGHLLGGFAIFSGLFLLWLRLQQGEALPALAGLRTLAVVALAVLVGQIALGGWTSANYAALVCTQLPICEGNWWQNLSPAEAFQPLPPPADSYEFGVLDYPARMTIHVSHRFGALLTTLVLGLLIWRLWQADAKRPAKVLTAMLALQFSLGVANVVGSLPLAVAVAHNGVAALLLLTLVWINTLAWRAGLVLKEMDNVESTACHA